MRSGAAFAEMLVEVIYPILALPLKHAQGDLAAVLIEVFKRAAIQRAKFDSSSLQFKRQTKQVHQTRRLEHILNGNRANDLVGPAREQKALTGSSSRLKNL